MGVGELIEEGFGFLILLQLLHQILGNFDHSLFKIRLDRDLDLVPERFADLLTDSLENDQHMAGPTHADQQPAIRHAFDECFDLGSLRTENALHIERDLYEPAASARVLDGGCESMFFRHETPRVDILTCS
jgi:hypothetical protein